MNASFGQNSARGNRRENFYKYDRKDSRDSLKGLNELRKSQEGRLKSPHRGGDYGAIGIRDKSADNNMRTTKQ